MISRIYINRDSLPPNEKEWAIIMENLSSPFENLKFRQQQGSNYAAYADAREYYERFDSVIGPGNWETHYDEVKFVNSRTVDFVPDPNVKDKYGKPKKAKRHEYDETLTGIKCTITIFGKSKADVGTEANTEAVKSSFSDSFKRAAVQWGPGRYIYSLGYFTSAKPRIPEEAEYIEPYDYDSRIQALKSKILEKAESMTGTNSDGLSFKEVATANIDEIFQNYSETCSILQKYRVSNYLTQVGKNLGSNISYGKIGE